MSTDLNRSRPAPRRSGLNLIDPDAVAARAWVPPTAPRRAVSPAEPGRPVLPGQAIAFRAGPTASSHAAAPVPGDAWTAPTRSERRRQQSRRRISMRLALIVAPGAAAIAAAAAYLLR